jgi:hypothetical protein
MLSGGVRGHLGSSHFVAHPLQLAWWLLGNRPLADRYQQPSREDDSKNPHFSLER